MIWIFVFLVASSIGIAEKNCMRELQERCVSLWVSFIVMRTNLVRTLKSSPRFHLLPAPPPRCLAARRVVLTRRNKMYEWQCLLWCLGFIYTRKGGWRIPFSGQRKFLLPIPNSWMALPFISGVWGGVWGVGGRERAVAMPQCALKLLLRTVKIARIHAHQ